MWDLFTGIFSLVIFPGGVFALAFGLLLKGLDRRFVARLQRRVGPPLIQPALDVLKLCTKEVLIPDVAQRTAFIAAPVAALGGIALCAAYLPIPGVSSGLPLSGDLLVLLYLFPMPAIALMLGGSASGSPYGAVGFTREMVLMLAYEVPLLLVLMTVALKAGALAGNVAEFSLDAIVNLQHLHGSFGFSWAMLPALLAWMVFLAGTTGVPPFDVPEAETELLEGPLLEYSGVLLALFNLASAIKTVVALGLGVVLFFPGSWDIGGPLGVLVNTAWFMFKCLLFMIPAMTLARARFGRFRIDQALRFFLTWPTGLAVLSLLLVWIGA